jgi:hypothetical protein
MNVSSEMFYSVISLMHNKLPCSSAIFRYKRLFDAKNSEGKVSPSHSPTRKMASPQIVKGLSPLIMKVPSRDGSMSPKKRIIINDDIRKRASNSILRSKIIFKDPRQFLNNYTIVKSENETIEPFLNDQNEDIESFKDSFEVGSNNGSISEKIN